MKATLLTALLCVLPLAAGAQSTESRDSTVRVPAPWSIDLPDHALGMVLTNFDSYQGAYDLSDGRVLYLTSRGHAMYAQIGDQDKVRVVGATADSFVAVDRSLKLSLNHRMDGEVRGDVLYIPHSSALAGLPVKPVLLTFGGN